MIWTLLFGALLLKASANACNQDFDSSTLTSPGYPAEYSNDYDECTIIYGDGITLTFTDFDLEAQDTCNWDYLTVTDSSGTELGKWCGENTPSGLVNLAGPLTVTFHTDGSVTRRGFSYDIARDEYEFQPGGTCTVIPPGVYDLVSPGFPQEYPDNFEGCVEINGPAISLSFSSFDLEAHDSCIWDYFAVEYDGQQQAIWCGTNSPGSLFYDGPVVLRFRTDGSVVRSGLALSVAQDCKVDERGGEYQGITSVTENGRECQRWDSNEPHAPWHTYNDDLFVDGSMSAAENYCRSIEDSDERPWCYTMDPEVRWEYCDIPLCAA